MIEATTIAEILRTRPNGRLFHREGQEVEFEVTQGPKGEQGQPSDVKVDVHVDRPEPPTDAVIRHNDGSMSTVKLKGSGK